MKAIQILTGCCLVLLLVGFFNVNTKAAPEHDENGSAPLMKRIISPMSVYVEGTSDTGKLSQEVKQFVLGESDTGKMMNARRFFASTAEDKSAMVYSMFENAIQKQGIEFLDDIRISALNSAIMNISETVPEQVIGGRGRYLKSLGLFGAYVLEVLDPGMGDKLFDKVSKSTGAAEREASAQEEQSSKLLDTLGRFPF